MAHHKCDDPWEKGMFQDVYVKIRKIRKWNMPFSIMDHHKYFYSERIFWRNLFSWRRGTYDVRMWFSIGKEAWFKTFDVKRSGTFCKLWRYKRFEKYSFPIKRHIRAKSSRSSCTKKYSSNNVLLISVLFESKFISLPMHMSKLQ